MAGSTWEYERPFTVPLKLIAKSKGGARHVMLQDDEGNNYDCVQGDLRGPHRMTRRSEASSSCNDCAEDGPGRKRQRSRPPNERGVGLYNEIPEDSEVKMVDNENTSPGYVIDSAGGHHILNAIRMGPDFFERVGNRVVMKDLEIWYRIQLNNEGNNRGDVIRLLVVYDRQPTDANGKGYIPTKETLITSYLPDGSKRSTSEDNINPTSLTRFLILKDYKIWLSQDSNSATVATGDLTGVDRYAKLADRFLINLNGLVTTFRQHEGVEANPGIRQITTGSLFIYFQGLHPADAGWNLHFRSRLRYYDA